MTTTPNQADYSFDIRPDGSAEVWRWVAGEGEVVAHVDVAETGGATLRWTDGRSAYRIFETPDQILAFVRSSNR